MESPNAEPLPAADHSLYDQYSQIRSNSGPLIFDPIPLAEQIPAPTAQPRWLWALPRIAPVLALMAIAALLWFLHRSELDEQRTTLISDVLWVEQNLRFQMERNLEQLEQLGIDAIQRQAHATNFEPRAQALMRNSQGLVRIVQVNAEGKPLTHLAPSAESTESVDRYFISPYARDTLEIARRIGRPEYSQIYAVRPGESQFDVSVPLVLNGQYAGAVIGSYSLPKLLSEMVPWWFAEKYRLNVVSEGGSVLASKSRVESSSAPLSYQVQFDPPGHGLILQVLSYRINTRLMPVLLVTTIIALLVAIVLSLSSLRKHVQGRYAAEQALREEHAFRKAMEDSLLTGLRARDLDGRIIYVNPAFCSMVGWSAEELVGLLPPMPYWAAEEFEQTREVHDRILEHGAPDQGVELRLQRKNGERFEALIFEAPLIDAHGRQRGWMGSVLDITERKRAQEFERQQQEKLQATARLVTMGELASTLAHELNQPLSAIASYNTGCINKLEGGEVQREQILAVLRKLGLQAQRAGQIIRRVHNFVRRSEPNRVPCNIDAVIDEAIELLEPAVRKRGAWITTQRASGLGEVMADRVMIEQVVLNLARNGLDAMAHLPTEKRSLELRTAKHDDGAMRVSIMDSGSGISSETAEKLFAPFFTTKTEGMGMGLNICRSIIELHQGRLWFETNPDGGTTFHFTLPFVEVTT